MYVITSSKNGPLCSKGISGCFCERLCKNPHEKSDNRIHVFCFAPAAKETYDTAVDVTYVGVVADHGVGVPKRKPSTLASKEKEENWSSRVTKGSTEDLFPRSTLSLKAKTGRRAKKFTIRVVLVVLSNRHSRKHNEVMVLNQFIRIVQRMFRCKRKTQWVRDGFPIELGFRAWFPSHNSVRLRLTKRYKQTQMGWLRIYIAGQ